MSVEERASVRKGKTETNEILETFRGKRVLVTGHTGFKGSWLSIWLNELGAAVAGYSLPPYTPKDNYLVSKIGLRLKSYEGDLRDAAHLQRVFLEFRPEIVFHLAAQTRVMDGYNDPKYTFDVNIGGTVNLLECFKMFEFTKAMVVVTSDKCYDNKEWIWPYRENDRIGGYDPYSASKGAVELVCSSYRDSFFNPSWYEKHGKCLSTARAGNVIGGGDWTPNQLVPDCIRAIENRRTIEIRNPLSTRPWQFVLEPLWGYLRLAAAMCADPVEYSGAWNFGPRIESVVPVETIANLIIRDYGRGQWEYLAVNGAIHEARSLSLDYSKAFLELGWRPTLTLEESVKMTVDWYTHYSNGEADMLGFCLEQIQAFQNQITLNGH